MDRIDHVVLIALACAQLSCMADTNDSASTHTSRTLVKATPPCEIVPQTIIDECKGVPKEDTGAVRTPSPASTDDSEQLEYHKCKCEKAFGARWKPRCRFDDGRDGGIVDAKWHCEDGQRYTFKVGEISVECPCSIPDRGMYGFCG